MQTFIDWLTKNYEWLFGGIGVVFITGLVGFFVKKKKNEVSIKQVQRSRDNSTNLQIGQIDNGKQK